MGVMDVVQWVGETLDKPGAAARGLLAGRPDQLANLIPFSDTLGITDPRNRTYGRDLLEQYGLLGENSPGLDWGDVAGFGVDVVTDPLNLVGGGLFGRTALGASRANRANRGIQAANRSTLMSAADDFARQGQSVARENAASQAMRANNALPEELLPEAYKVYRELPTASHASTVPGPLTVADEGLRMDPEYLSFPEDLMEVNPARRALDNDDINAIGRRLNEYFADPNPDIPRIGEVERQAQNAVRMLRSNNPLEMASGRTVPEGVFPEALDAIELQAKSLHNKRVRDEMIETWNPGFQVGDELSEDMRFALDDYMSGEGGRIARRNMMADLSPIRDARTLIDELTDSLSPARSAGESFYVVPRGKVVNYSDTLDPDIIRPFQNKQAAMSPELWKPMTSDLYDALSGEAAKGKTYYDYMFKDLPGRVSVALPEMKPTMHGFPGLAGVVDPKIAMARFAEGADTYLPYVAPQLQSRPRWIPPALEQLQSVPKTPSWLLPMLAGQNTVGRMGGV